MKNLLLAALLVCLCGKVLYAESDFIVEDKQVNFTAHEITVTNPATEKEDVLGMMGAGAHYVGSDKFLACDAAEKSAVEGSLTALGFTYSTVSTSTSAAQDTLYSQYNGMRVSKSDYEALGF